MREVAEERTGIAWDNKRGALRPLVDNKFDNKSPVRCLRPASQDLT